MTKVGRESGMKKDINERRHERRILCEGRWISRIKKIVKAEKVEVKDNNK